MNDLSRRDLLTGATALAATTALTSLGAFTAQAAVPPSGAQAPGFYRYKVGAYECTSINDGARTFPMPDTFVKNVPKEEALAAAEDGRSVVTREQDFVAVPYYAWAHRGEGEMAVWLPRRVQLEFPVP